jgi:hypothetical protein
MVEKMEPTAEKLQVPKDMLPRLTQVFQKGIRIEIETGCTLESLLCNQWELSPEFVLQKISTLFLNGKPVDDISGARVEQGAVLALSSAMPGLVGAVMRRGGFFSSLRGGITYREKAPVDRICRGLITVKLFNLLIEEIGPRFLKQGFFADPGDLPEDLMKGLDKRLIGEGDVFVADDLN